MSVADLDLNGIMPSQVCANRGEPTNPENGNLAVLISDCDAADQKVSSCAYYWRLAFIICTDYRLEHHFRYFVNVVQIAVLFKNKLLFRSRG